MSVWKALREKARFLSFHSRHALRHIFPSFLWKSGISVLSGAAAPRRLQLLRLALLQQTTSHFYFDRCISLPCVATASLRRCTTMAGLSKYSSVPLPARGKHRSGFSLFFSFWQARKLEAVFAGCDIHNQFGVSWSYPGGCVFPWLVYSDVVLAVISHVLLLEVMYILCCRMKLVSYSSSSQALHSQACELLFVLIPRCVSLGRAGRRGNACSSLKQVPGHVRHNLG